MRPEDVRDIALKALDEVKGIDIVSINVQDTTSITDYMVICTGRSTPHIKALAENVSTKAKENNIQFVRTEGEKGDEWILVDLGDVVIHVMLPATREFYSLEDLWEPVRELRDHNAG